MVRLSLFTVSAYLFLVVFCWSFSAFAQGDYADYNEESVGMVDYSDSVAVGDAPAPSDESADDVIEAPPASSVAPEVVSIDEPTASQDVVAPDGSEGGATENGVSAEAEAMIQLDNESILASGAEGSEAKKARDKKRDKREPWEWGAVRHHTGWSGTAGLMDMKEAGSNEMGNLSMGIFAGFFKYDDYLVRDDENSAMAGTLNFRATVWKYIELRTAIRSYSNYNNQEYPELFQTIGDMELGIKGFYSPIELITVGLDMNFNFLNSVGKVGMDWSGVSVGFDGLATFDFASISDNVPLRAHLLLGYLFDNAYHIIEDVESAGGGCGSDLDNDGQVEYTGCLSPVERTALGIDRNDQFRLGVAVDAALPYVSPILEYHIDVPVNRQGFVCPQIPGSYDSCMADSGAKSMRQWLNIGVRGLPPVKGLSVDFGVEIGLAGYAPSVHELAAQEPYMVKFGLAYQLNPFEEPEKCEPVEKIVQVPAETVEAPRGAQIVGMVHDSASTETPVGDAVVTYHGLELNPQVTSGAGRFNSYELPAGEVILVVSAPNYEEQSFTVSVPEEGFVEQLFPLIAKPQKGVASVTVVSEKGDPIAGVEVQVHGAANGTFTSDTEGKVMLESDAGTLTFSVSNDDFLHKQINVEVTPDSHQKAQMELRAKSKKKLVVVKKDRIRIKRKIHFKTNADEIDSSSFALIDEIADTLMKNPQIVKVEIQGHTDDRGPRKNNIELSEGRANAVRTYLINAGVDASRLDAKGFGPDKPIAPNVIKTGRAKNRRVEFHIRSSK